MLLGGAFYFFLENALEWKEMAYFFLPSTEDRPLIAYEEEDLEFSTFLQAGFVRILLPVEPAYAEIMLYFLASGMVWTGQHCFTPANAESVDLINNLKDLAQRPNKGKLESRPWRITIPTSMTVLQKDETLPSFERGKDHAAYE